MAMAGTPGGRPWIALSWQSLSFCIYYKLAKALGFNQPRLFTVFVHENYDRTAELKFLRDEYGADLDSDLIVFTTYFDDPDHPAWPFPGMVEVTQLTA
jgi:hypothetical protein